MSPPPPPARAMRRTRFSVRFADFASRWLISFGGIGAILAICLIFVFLAWVAAPLFIPARTAALPALEEPFIVAPPLRLGVDEYQSLGWALMPGGDIVLFRLDDGAALEERNLFPGRELTAVGFTIDNRAIFGFADGEVQLGSIGFSTQFLRLEDAPPDLRALNIGEYAEHDGGLVQMTPESQLRVQRLSVQLDEPPPTESQSPILLVDGDFTSSGPVYVSLNAEGRLRFSEVRKRENMLTGETHLTANSVDLPYADGGRGTPRFLKLGTLGSVLYVAWSDGTTLRYDLRNKNQPQVAETVDLVEDSGAELTALEMLIGRSTLISGDSQGRLTAWFLTKPSGAGTSDGAYLTAGHRGYFTPSSPVTALAPSNRSRALAAGFANGEIRLYNATTENLLGQLDFASAGGPPPALTMAPKEDALIAAGEGGVWRWQIDLRHPEASLRSMFLPVWYESYEKPEHVWQSSSGTDNFEPKYGMWPLVFGTIKATAFSMLFGAPLALLAAIYTSEFLNPKFRSRIKPIIELMASLPSVALGFLAALVFAPFVEQWLPVALATPIVMPFTVLLFAHLWQMAPSRLLIPLSRFRLLFIFLSLPVGMAGSLCLGPWMERLLFAGDIFRWLDGQIGHGTGGWMLIFTPLSALAVMALWSALGSPALRGASLNWRESRVAGGQMAVFLTGAAATLILALAAGAGLAALGLDPRGGAVGTYVQRNAMVVGFVMGFAIVPIIYTIAEDALTSVPEHLRSASLAAGATPWQTAVRIIIPTAMSGLFSALMIGFGRAVGETMIVLMAAGNTPVMDWNVFNGFRTLSANIAVELPEAVRNSTHYRTLFLAALTLFLMTFVLNTAAELVRLRFRKKATQL